MNTIVHFFTGYLFARVLKNREFRFECIYVSIAALLPDFDFIIGKIVPGFEHGVWTHTGVAGILMAFLWALFTHPFVRSSARHDKLFLYLFGLALLGVLSHLVLDAFTYYESAADTTHHMFFWPLWDFPVHINKMFPGTSYAVRVWVEVIYSIFVGCTIIIFQWAVKKQNPFKMFNPTTWRITNEKTPEPVPFDGKIPITIWVYAMLLFLLIALNLIWGLF